MLDKIDPKKVAERLAGGGTLKQGVVKLPESVWLLTSAQTVDCPHCGETSRNGFVEEDSETVLCSHCKKEIRILDKEVTELKHLDVPDDVIEKLMASMNPTRMSIGCKVRKDP